MASASEDVVITRKRLSSYCFTSCSLVVLFIHGLVHILIMFPAADILIILNTNLTA